MRQVLQSSKALLNVLASGADECGVDLRGGHSCSGRRGPWEAWPRGPRKAKFWLAIAKSWLQLEL